MSKSEETIFINQPVNKEAYKKIKALAALEGKKIQEIINEAIIFYSSRKIKK